MALNYVWIFMILVGFLVATIQAFITGDFTIFSTLLTGIFDSADISFEICLGLAGVMSFWMGIMNIGNDAGLIAVLSRWMSPFFRVLFPSIPAGNKAFGSMSMNFSANMLGLDNAATPLGLQAMKDLQELNKEKDTASDAQIMFLVMNTAGVTLIPTSIIAIRQTMAAEQGLTGFNGADIFLPTLIVTFLSFVIAVLIVAMIQKINIFKLPILIFLLIFGGLIAGLFTIATQSEASNIGNVVGVIGSFIIMLVIIAFILSGFIKKINIYNSFITGAKGGFQLVIDIAPYLVAMLFAISIFRTSGCLDYILGGIKTIFQAIGTDTRFVDALPVGLMKPFSGSGARGILVDIMNTYGVDSFPAKLASIMQGSTETTFYVLAVYFGSVGIINSRYAVFCGLLADLASIIIAIFVGYFFYG